MGTAAATGTGAATGKQRPKPRPRFGGTRPEAQVGAGMGTGMGMGMGEATATAPVTPRIRAVHPLPRREIQAEQPSGSRPVDNSGRETVGESSEESEEDVPTVEGTTPKKRRIHKPRPRPQPSTPRPTPCARCHRLDRDCYDQLNGIHACYGCGKAKVRCEVGGVATPKKGKGPAPKKKTAPSASGEESSTRRFTRAEKGKSKGELVLLIMIHPTTKQHSHSSTY